MERYRSKVVSADEALEEVKSEQRVLIGSGCAVPRELAAALTRRAQVLEGVEIVHLLTMGDMDYMDPQYAGAFRHNAFFLGANARKAVREGRADYMPIFLSEIPALFEKDLRVDVALISVSPPDEHGFCSYGVSVDIVKPAAERARIVIAEVNEAMPRTLGDSFIHLSKIRHVVENSQALPTLDRTEFTEVHERIGKNVAELVEDGATLQMGIGAIPDAVLFNIGDRRDLGVHTEMFSDGVVDLFNKGVITNEKKTLHRGKIISSFLMGSKDLYDFADNNPLIELRPSHYTNDPFVISKNVKMTAINSAIEVDLTGQVCADSMGSAFYSGIGGQVDFMRGAARSEGGKPIVALPSTAKGGELSRITPILKPGAGVVTSRGDAHYVATEYGVAYLHGRNVRQRARALIDIAHPKFRDELIKEARGLGYF